MNALGTGVNRMKKSVGPFQTPGGGGGTPVLSNRFFYAHDVPIFFFE